MERTTTSTDLPVNSNFSIYPLDEFTGTMTNEYMNKIGYDGNVELTLNHGTNGKKPNYYEDTESEDDFKIGNP